MTLVGQDEIRRSMILVIFQTCFYFLGLEGFVFGKSFSRFVLREHSSQNAPSPVSLKQKQKNPVNPVDATSGLVFAVTQVTSRMLHLSSLLCNFFTNPERDRVLRLLLTSSLHAYPEAKQSKGINDHFVHT